MICFAILAHKDEKALQQQIRNIRKHNGRSAKIVLYNGGKNPHFAKRLCRDENVMYCPYSRPLEWGKLARFHYDVMRWLEEKKVTYDYLAILDYDVLFVHCGLENLLNKTMSDCDCTVSILRRLTNRGKTAWRPGQTMWKEWNRWQPFFKSGHFYGTFNPMQVYRHGIIKKILARIDKPKLEQLIANTNTFALEEMLTITLAILSGGKCKEYPKAVTQYLRVYPRIRLREAKEALKKPNVLFVHPVKDAAVWKFITGAGS